LYFGLLEKDFIVRHYETTRVVQNKREVIFNMPCRKIKDHRIIITGNGLQDGFPESLFHKRIIVTTGKLPYDKPRKVCQHATEAEILHHTINMIVPFCDVLNEKYPAFLNSIGGSLKTIENRKISTMQESFRPTNAIQGTGRDDVSDRAIGKYGKETGQCGSIGRESGDMPGHHSMQRWDIVYSQKIVKAGYVTETDH